MLTPQTGRHVGQTFLFAWLGQQPANRNVYATGTAQRGANILVCLAYLPGWGNRPQTGMFTPQARRHVGQTFLFAWLGQPPANRNVYATGTAPRGANILVCLAGATARK